MATAHIEIPATAWTPLDDAGAHPGLEAADLGTVSVLELAFADSVDEITDSGLMVPVDADTSGTVTFRLFHRAKTGAASKNTKYRFSHRPLADGEATDGAYTNEDSGDLAMDATTGDLNVHTWTETMSNLGWQPRDEILAQLARIAASANDLVGDDLVRRLVIEIPLA